MPHGSALNCVVQDDLDSGVLLCLPPGPVEVFLDRTRKTLLSYLCHSLTLCFLMANKPSETERACSLSL